MYKMLCNYQYASLFASTKKMRKDEQTKHV